ncbi:ribonuclease P protein component [Limnohabitans sp. TS-CS-82]|uniref:ribonuclease P protein component n=1 Tax=Limnohabitans sp. TS-CS-82 TaxID=2094193 RepID=UPI000CF2BBAD|nr:ribonuclease P protein component [Limnohabitans sp. TS-CS-82]PQA83497.1 ribonuclease P protein component [Limnohabitans sp. TS-CS-82]
MSAVERLTQWAEFQAVMAAGSVARTPHFVLHQWRPTQINLAGPEFEKTQALFLHDVLMLGALTPKRWAKRAVTRNLIRRQIHSVSQEFAAQLTPTPYVVRLRTTFDTKKFISASSDALKIAVREELTQLFGKVISP